MMMMMMMNMFSCPSGPGNMEAVSLHCQSAHQGKCLSALASLDAAVAQTGGAYQSRLAGTR